jgi:hypothetical protein
MNHGSPPPPLLLGIIIIFLVIFLFRKSGKYEPEEIRRRKLAALAQKLQLQFNPKNDFKLAERFLFLTWLKRGDVPDVRYAYNVFHGPHLGYPVTLFDYHFSTSGGKSGLDYYWSAFVLEMETYFPDLMILHESRESRLAETIGESHITFESAEFSHIFRVRSSDKKFAYDVCHPRMMEYLLANKDLTIEIRGRAAAVLFEDWLHPERVESNLSRLIEIRKLLPQYLFTKT